MPPELVDLLSQIEPGSFIQGLTAGTLLTVTVFSLVTNLRWSPEHMLSVTRKLVAKHGMVGFAQSVGFSLLIDLIKSPVDAAKGIQRKQNPQILIPRKQVSSRRRPGNGAARGNEVVTLKQAFTKQVLEGKIEDLKVDMSADDSPRVTGSVVLTKEDAPWLA